MVLMPQDVEAGGFEPVAQSEEAADDREQGQKGRCHTHSPTVPHTFLLTYRLI